MVDGYSDDQKCGVVLWSTVIPTIRGVVLFYGRRLFRRSEVWCCFMVDGYSDDQKCGVVDGSDDQGVMLFMGKGHIWFSACKLKNGCIIVASERSERADLLVSRARFFAISTGTAQTKALRNSKYA